MKTRKLACVAGTVVLVALALPLLMAAQEHERFGTATTRTVTGTEIGHYKNGPLPVDLSAVVVAAYVPNGSGGYNVITGSGTSSGTFSISNVSTGRYLLQLGSTYLATSNTVVDADFNSGERSNGVAANTSTTVTFDLTNLNAWQSTDVFEMVCPNNAAFDEFQGTVGETSFVGTFPYTGSLSDGSQGDQYFILQLSTQPVGGYPFTAAGRSFQVPKFTQPQGSDTQINGSLGTLPQTFQFEANINGADLTAQALAANPKAVLAGTAVVLDVYPGSLAKGELTSTPDLVGYNLSFFAGGPLLTTNGDLGTVFYGNPFPPAGWPLFDLYEWDAVTKYVAPGATSGTTILTSTLGYDTTLPTTTSPIKPLVGVVTNPTINGKNFFANHAGVGSMPILKWSPPSVGTATFYQVTLYQLSNVGGRTVITGTTQFRTAGTTLTIPQGLLSTGMGYVFRIRSRYIPGLNFAKTPFMSGPVSALTDVISGMMQP